MNVGAMISKIGRDIDRRNKTDIRIYPSMVFAILALYTGVAMYSIFSGSADVLKMVGLMSSWDDIQEMFSIVIVGSGLMMAVMFVLASRTYRHNKRDASLMNDVCTLFEYLLPDGEKDPDLKRMRSCIYEGIKQEVLFVTFFIALVPAVVAVLVYLRGFTSEPDLLSRNLLLFSFVFSLFVILLNINFSKIHEEKFIIFSDGCTDALMKLGISMKRYEQVIGSRNVYLLAFLSVATLGVFTMVWLCISMRDFNRHMDQQWNFENNLFHALGIIRNREEAFKGMFGDESQR